MKKSRMILASALLASVMTLSLALSASAESGGLPESPDTESSVITEKHDPCIIVKDPDMPADPRFFKGKRIYIGETIDKKTTGGIRGMVNVRSGIYKRQLDWADGSTTWNYGVDAQVVEPTTGILDTVTTDLEINARFFTKDSITLKNNEANTNYLKVELPADDFIFCHAEISSSTRTFGNMETEINRVLE